MCIFTSTSNVWLNKYICRSTCTCICIYKQIYRWYMHLSVYVYAYTDRYTIDFHWFSNCFCWFPLIFNDFCYILEPIFDDFKHLGLCSWHMEVGWALGATEHHFGSILISFWLQLGCILAPIGIHFGSILVFLGAS